MIKNIFKIDLNPKRVYGLDILRALAIIFVVFGHSKAFMPKDYLFTANLLTFDGVTIFFVLSGFLIGKILIKVFNNSNEKNILINFWIRRWFRTLPNYFLILIILIIIHSLFTNNFNFLDYKSYFIFSQNLFYNHPPFFDEAWSLSIEEWFYLLIPIILITLIKIFNFSIKRSILYTAIGILIVVTCFRYFRYVHLTMNTYLDWDLIYRKQVITRFDSIMYGIIGAYISVYYIALWEKFRKQTLIIGIVLMILVQLIIKITSDYQSLFFCVFSFSIYSLATLLVLPYLSTYKNGNGIIYKWMTTISLISYSMYLINFSLVKFWIIKKINWHSFTDSYYSLILIKYSAFWIITIVVSLLIYKYFEVPMMRLRDHEFVKRLFPTKENKLND